MLAAMWTVDYLSRANPEGHPYWIRLDLGPQVLVFTLAVALVTAFAFGVLPALRSSRTDLSLTLGQGNRSTTGGSQRQRLQKTLVIAQIALALTLLYGAGLVARSLMALTHIDAGFDTDRLLSFYTYLAGERYAEDAPEFTVVGVAPKIYYEEPGEETDQSRLQVHLPFARSPRREMAVLVRTAGDTVVSSAAVQRTLGALDATLPLYQVRTMDTIRREVLWGERMQLKLFGSFALLALFMSVLGIYGVMAFVVSQQVPEIGVRMALGADRRAIGRLFLRQGLALIATGVALGLAGRRREAVRADRNVWFRYLWLMGAPPRRRAPRSEP